MTMHPTQGGRVFVAHGRSHATLVLYKKADVTLLYFVVVYDAQKVFAGYLTFSQIQDLVPFHSAPLSVELCGIGRDVADTVHAWLSSAYLSLIAA